MPRPARALSSPPRPSTPAERRERARTLLRKRLDGATGRHSDPQPARTTAPAPADQSVSERPTYSPKERRESLINSLKNSVHQSGSAAARARRPTQDAIELHVGQSKESEARGDWLGAANAMRLALALDQDDLEMQRECERLSFKVAESLADNYQKQAKYEERAGKWRAAGLSWGRVSDGRPNDAAAALSAANALLKAGAELRHAERHARRAVEIQGENIDNLCLLVRIYLAAGLKLNARRELEQAARLDRDHEVVKNLMKEAR